MTIDIEKIHQDLEQFKRDQKWETRKLVVSTVVAAAALVLAGVGIGTFFSAHHEPAAATACPSAGTK